MELGGNQWPIKKASASIVGGACVATATMSTSFASRCFSAAQPSVRCVGVSRRAIIDQSRAGKSSSRAWGLAVGVLSVAASANVFAQRRVTGAAVALRRSRGLRTTRQSVLTADGEGRDRFVVKGGASTAAPGPQVVFVIGGPGSGKGTQCELIAKKFGFHHLSAGDLLRAERAREGSELGAMIEEVIKSGGTVPSEVIAELLEAAMREAGWSKGKFIIDGYPRSEAQLKGWEATLSKKVDFLFCLSLEVSQDEMRKRLLGRAETSGRLDDNEETIVKRFETFKAETGPLLDYFKSKGNLRQVDGGRSVDQVWGSVQGLLQEKKASTVSNASGSSGGALKNLLLG